MEALTQYLDFYREHGATLDANAPALLNGRRPRAYAALEGARLPRRGDEGYEASSPEEMLAPDLGINAGRVPLQADVAAAFRCGVPAMSTLMAFVVGDTFRGMQGLEEKLPEGVTFMSLRRACEEHPELVERALGSIAPAERPLVALNDLLLQDGVLVHVKRGLHVAKPLQLVNLNAAPAPMLFTCRLLVVLEEDAALDLLICDHTLRGYAAATSLQVTELLLGRGARLGIYDIEESNADTGRLSELYARQEEGSELTAATATLQCGTTRNDITVDLVGPRARTLLAGMAVATGEMHVDNDTCVNHRVGRCTSDQRFKYVLDDRASGAFEGSIIVAPGAKYTEAYQNNRNILASRGATMHSKPLLEIYNDDVKCSHGATTGQLDPAALFYMQTRGIPTEEARRMLMQAFMADVIDLLPLAGLRERLHHLVERRFCGESADCAACHKA